MRRRRFVQLSGLGAIGAPVVAKASSPLKSELRIFQDSPDVVVVGAGTFGMWTAYHLQASGAKVTLLDAYGPGNSRASSGGETRLIQCDNDNNVYVQSAKRAFDWWKNMETLSGEQLVLPTGKLSMSPEASYREYAENRKQQLVAQGINNTEVLGPDEIRYRWPQIHSEDIAAGMFNSGGPSGSTLMARKGLQTVAKVFEKGGGRLLIGKGTPVLKQGRVEGIAVEGGETLNAQHYIFACGPWLTKIFPELLWPKLQVQRRDVLFVGTPPGDHRFSFPNLPEWGVAGSGYYGFPDIEHRGLKVAPYPDYNAFDPDVDERLVNHYQVKRAHEFVKHRFPALGDQPIIESRVCQVTNSTDGNFIVDQVPSSDNAWVIGAGSGHGFKHGPAIGEYAAKRILGEGSDPLWDSNFKMKPETF
ncbi:MAG: FAD-dependent oxidoreductase [Bacteroidota bacterium]